MKKIHQIFPLAHLLILIISPACLIGQVQNYGNLKLHDACNIATYGDFTNNGSFNNNEGTLHLVGSNNQKLDGDSVIQVFNLSLDKTNNNVQLDNVLKIGGVLNFDIGSIHSDHSDYNSEYVEFLDGATYTGASDSSHIDGVVRKTGDDEFTFPIGSESSLRTIKISAPSSTSDHFTSYYSDTNPDSLYNRDSLESGLNHVSSCEYWMLDKTNGNSNPTVTLSWDDNSCEINDVCALQIASWNGSQWVSEGNGGVQGASGNFSIISGEACSSPLGVQNFNFFTLGSTNNINSLPITLVSFDAEVCENSVCLNWQTASEINNDFFSIEKSVDGLNWEHVKDIDGAGNSLVLLKYKTIDPEPFQGVSYYRLKQTDYDYHFSYSKPVAVKLNSSQRNRLALFPNPARDHITISGKNIELGAIRIYNNVGQDVTSLVTCINKTSSKLQFNVAQLKPGVYHLKTLSEFWVFVKQ